MPDFTKEELLQIIEYSEADCVEFKESLSGSATERIREAICAFANDLPARGKPGFVFVGVRDNRTIAGLPVTDRLLVQLANMKTDGNIVPPPSLNVEKRVLQGKEIAMVTVQPSDSPPVRYRGVIHIRTGPRRDIATAQEERMLNEKRRYGDIPSTCIPSPRPAFPTLTSFSSRTNIYRKLLPLRYCKPMSALPKNVLPRRR